MSGHTRGPWRIEEKRGRKGRAHITGPEWNKFASVVVRMRDEPVECEEGLANAKLIASAPDHALLLAAIVAGVARWRPFDGNPEGAGEICVDGLAYAAHLDATGCPEIADGRRAALINALRAAGRLP